MSYPKWRTLASKYLVQDRWIRLRADKCVSPDGHTIDPYYVLEYADWITCLAIDDNDDVIMIRQYRHGAGEYVLEVIAGNSETEDTDMEAAARRELREEIGYTGGTVVPVGVSYANPANQTNKVHAFLAFGGGCNDAQALEPGESIHIEKMPFREVVHRMSQSGEHELFQGLHLANVFQAVRYIQASDDPRLQRLQEKLD